MNTDRLNRMRLRKILNNLKEHGWKPSEIDNGGDTNEPCGEIDPVEDALCMAFDTATTFLYMVKPGHRFSWFQIVPSSDPDELVADWNCADEEFNSLMDQLV